MDGASSLQERALDAWGSTILELNNNARKKLALLGLIHAAVPFNETQAAHIRGASSEKEAAVRHDRIVRHHARRAGISPPPPKRVCARNW